jgi:hypothetical protein
MMSQIYSFRRLRNPIPQKKNAAAVIGISGDIP